MAGLNAQPGKDEAPKKAETGAPEEDDAGTAHQDGAVTPDDVTLFARRLARFDPELTIKIADGNLWAVLPFKVLAHRRARNVPPSGLYRAGDLLGAGTGTGGTGTAHPLLGASWRQRLPKEPFETLESVPLTTVAKMDAMAAQTLKEARGQGIGDRRLRDALLDHAPITVSTDDGARYEVSQRLITALIRMGFAGPIEDAGTVLVLLHRGRLGLAGIHGTVWEIDHTLTLSPR